MFLLCQEASSKRLEGSSCGKVAAAPAASVQLPLAAVPRTPVEPPPLPAAQAWLHSLSYLHSWVAAKSANKNYI